MKKFMPFVVLVLAVLTFMTDGAALAIVLVVLLALAVGTLVMVTSQNAADTDFPNLDRLTCAFARPVTWTGKDMTLNTGGLHHALQLGGIWT